MARKNSKYGLISHRDVNALNKQKMRRDLSRAAKGALIAGATGVGAVVGGPVGAAVGAGVGTGYASAISLVEKQAEELVQKRRSRRQRK
jgi:uncharacterized protein YcfJ